MSSERNRPVCSPQTNSLTSLSITEKSRQRNSTGSTTVASKTMGFDVQCVYETFVNALREPNNPKSPIGIQDYIDGYRELLKFFDQLGYVFKFVKDDVVEKLGILQSFIDKNKKGAAHFDTIQQVIDYETEKDLIKSNPIDNFARTLLRLHRALLFIIQFLQGLNDRPPTESTAAIAANSYNATLYQHHGFIVRQSVKIGFHVLPTRQKLDDIIYHGRKAESTDQYNTFMKTIKQIYDSIEAYYADKKYLQLP